MQSADTGTPIAENAWEKGRGKHRASCIDLIEQRWARHRESLDWLGREQRIETNMVCNQIDIEGKEVLIVGESKGEHESGGRKLHWRGRRHGGEGKVHQQMQTMGGGSKNERTEGMMG